MKKFFFTGKLCLYIPLLLIPLFSNAQEVNDTVTIYIENKIEMNIVLNDFNDLRDSNNIANKLESFTKHLPSILNQLSPEKAELVTYLHDSSATVEPYDSKNIFLMNGDKMVNTGIRDKVLIKNNKAEVFLITADLSNVENVPLTDYYREVVKQLPPKTRLSKILYFQCKEGTVNSVKEKNIDPGAMDYIELSFGAGAGLVRNQWVGDIHLRMGIGLYKKSELNHYPYLSAQFLYDFPSSNGTNINTFLNVGYFLDLDRKEEPENLGVEFGYLISRQGNLFNENTMRFGLNWSNSFGVTVSPQLFIEEGFKKAFPGIRIGFGL